MKFLLFKEHVGPMGFHSQILASVVYRDYHIRKDMGALYLHHLWTNVHEDSSRIQHPSGTYVFKILRLFSDDNFRCYFRMEYYRVYRSSVVTSALLPSVI